MTASFNSEAVKTTLRGLMLFQNNPPSFASFSKISSQSSVTLSHTIENIANDSLG